MTTVLKNAGHHASDTTRQSPLVQQHEVFFSPLFCAVSLSTLVVFIEKDSWFPAILKFCANQVPVEQCNELLIVGAALILCIPSVLLQYANQVPALEFPQAAAHNTGAVPAHTASQQKRIADGVNQLMQYPYNNRLRKRHAPSMMTNSTHLNASATWVRIIVQRAYGAYVVFAQPLNKCLVMTVRQEHTGA